MLSFRATADFGNSGHFIARLKGRDAKFTFDREFIGRKSGKRNDICEADVDEPGIYEECDSGKRGKVNTYYLVIELEGKLGGWVIEKEHAMALAKRLDNRERLEDMAKVWWADEEAQALRESLIDWRKAVIVEGSADWIGRMSRPEKLKRAIGPYAAGAEVPQAEFQPVLLAEIEAVSARIAALAAEGRHAKDGYEIISPAEAKKAQAGATIDTAVAACWAAMQALPLKDQRKVLAALKAKVNPPKPTESVQAEADPAAGA